MLGAKKSLDAFLISSPVEHSPALDMRQRGPTTTSVSRRSRVLIPANNSQSISGGGVDISQEPLNIAKSTPRIYHPPP